VISGSIARRYAKALHDLAAEEGLVAEVGAALASFAEAIAAVDDGSLAPGVLDGDARAKMGAALAAPLGAQTTLAKFVQLLAARDRLAALPSIHEHFIRIDDRAAGRVRLTVTTAAPLEQSQIDAVVAAFRSLTGGNAVPRVRTDPEMLGGAVVEIEGRVYDGSVKTRLSRLAARMAGDA
jgi:F-type H+-transporting ATPase subunit delta